MRGLADCRTSAHGTFRTIADVIRGVRTPRALSQPTSRPTGRDRELQLVTGGRTPDSVHSERQAETVSDVRLVGWDVRRERRGTAFYVAAQLRT